MVGSPVVPFYFFAQGEPLAEGHNVDYKRLGSRAARVIGWTRGSDPHKFPESISQHAPSNLSPSEARLQPSLSSLHPSIPHWCSPSFGDFPRPAPNEIRRRNTKSASH